MIKNGYYIFRPWIVVYDNVRGEDDIAYLHYHDKMENAMKELDAKLKIGTKLECLSFGKHGIKRIKVFI